MDGWTYDFDEDLRGLGEVIERHLHPEFTFVNIGANDGVNSDPVWPFATKHGWRGVCVEPAPAVFELLQANYSPYPRVQTVRAAISFGRPASSSRISPMTCGHLSTRSWDTATSSRAKRARA